MWIATDELRETRNEQLPNAKTLIHGNEFEILKTNHARIAKNIWMVMPNRAHGLIMLGDYDFDNGVE